MMFLDSSDVFPGEGIITFDPVAKKDPRGRMSRPWWVIGTIEGDIVKYYSWFLQRKHGIRLQSPAWGPHISIVRGEETTLDIWEQFKKKYDQMPFKFVYKVSLRTNGDHWWMNVDCDFLTEFRLEMGYPEESEYGFHLTLGMPTPLHLEQSKNIWRSYKKRLNLH